MTFQTLMSALNFRNMQKFQLKVLHNAKIAEERLGKYNYIEHLPCLSNNILNIFSAKINYAKVSINSLKVDFSYKY